MGYEPTNLRYALKTERQNSLLQKQNTSISEGIAIFFPKMLRLGVKSNKATCFKLMDVTKYSPI